MCVISESFYWTLKGKTTKQNPGHCSGKQTGLITVNLDRGWTWFRGAGAVCTPSILKGVRGSQVSQALRQWQNLQPLNCITLEYKLQWLEQGLGFAGWILRDFTFS